ncbi:MAG: type II toxin-antitoxin system VapC family toxin [Rhodospirillales bacterium]|nr:type II toxin-antitoxin system VapC family toxin [Rhodospirillales bacterium]
MIGVDTNVLVRFIVQDDPVQSLQARTYLASELAQNGGVAICNVVFCEFVWVLGRSYRFSRSDIVGALDRILATENTWVEDRDILREAIEAFRVGAVQDFADAVIALTNKRKGNCATTVTFDRNAAATFKEGFTLLTDLYP